MTTTNIDPTEVDFFTNPDIASKAEPYFDYMLANHPVFREPKYGVVIVTGYEEALQVYEPEVYSSIIRVGGPVIDLPVELVGEEITEILEQHRDYFGASDQIVTFDPPVHTDHRAILMGLITPKRLKENEQFLKDTADRFLDEILPKGKAEFIWDYAKGYTILAVADLLGVPVEDHKMLLDLLAANPGPVLGNLELQTNNHQSGIEKLYDYFIAKIVERRENPQDDVLTGMAVATFPDGSLPQPLEVARIAANLFSAGQETTVQLLGISMARIADDHKLQELLRNDTSLLPKFLEETLRIEAPIKGSFRITKTATTLGGLDLPPGTNVMLLHGAAGRDPRVFENPEDFEVTRANARQHLAFGRGIHTCPGAPLARAEAVFSLQRFLERTSSIQISEEHHGPSGAREWDLIRSYKFRGHSQLYITYNQAES